MDTLTPDLPTAPPQLDQPQMTTHSPQGISPSPWLSAYVAFSRTWSPRAYDGFHVACGLWILSTVAARRVVLRLGKEYYTPLYIALVARSSLYSKSTTTAIALDTLAAAGLDWLLAPDNSTPRRFIRDLSLKLPVNYAALSPPQRDRAHKRLALTARRGWFYDEFGQQLANLSREQGSLADFRSLLRRLDDCKDSYEYAAFGHSSDVLRRPYLALLANLTPADMQRSSRRGSSLWNDGFWARFAFAVPPAAGYASDHTRFPDGLRAIPPALSAPLRAWHERLGMPRLAITPTPSLGTAGAEVGEGCTAPWPGTPGTLPLSPSPSPWPGTPGTLPLSPSPTLAVEPLDPVVCTLGEGVKEAFYTYHDDLLEMAQGNNLPDLDASYARLAEKALRVAMLVASLENDNHVEQVHWSLGRTIAEDWRADLDALYDQMAPASGGGIPPAPEPSLEERLISILRKHPRSTAADVARYVRGLSTQAAHEALGPLVYGGRIAAYVDGRTLRYEVI